MARPIPSADCLFFQIAACCVCVQLLVFFVLSSRKYGIRGHNCWMLRTRNDWNRTCGGKFIFFCLTRIFSTFNPFIQHWLESNLRMKIICVNELKPNRMNASLFWCEILCVFFCSLWRDLKISYFNSSPIMQTTWQNLECNFQGNCLVRDATSLNQWKKWNIFLICYIFSLFLFTSSLFFAHSIGINTE